MWKQQEKYFGNPIAGLLMSYMLLKKHVNTTYDSFLKVRRSPSFGISPERKLVDKFLRSIAKEMSKFKP